MPKKITASGKKKITASKLDALDNLGSNSLDFDSAETTLEGAAGQFIDRIHKNVEALGMNVTGKINDIRIEPTANGIQIIAPAHLVYQDLGVSGTEIKYNTPFAYSDKMPPPDVIKEWIEARGIRSVNNEKYHGKKSDLEEGAAFAIAKAIQRDGIKPKNVVQKEIPKFIEDVKKAVGNAVKISIIQALKNE